MANDTCSAASSSLDGIDILRDLPDDDRALLSKRASWREYGKGEQIIDKDSESRDVYFIVSGMVQVVNYSFSGREVSYAEIEAGGFFGEMAAIDNKPRSAAVVAMKKTTLASLSPELFKQSVLEAPAFGWAIMARLVALMRGSNDRIMDLSTLSAYSRVYAHLLRMAKPAMNEEDFSATIDNLPTHSSLASRAGTTRETVARAISNLVAQGLAEKRPRGLHFPDLMEIEELVESESA